MAGGVIELRREEGAGRSTLTLRARAACGAGRHRITTRGGCRPQPQSNQRRNTGSQAVLVTDEYLTQGWIQPRDKPVSDFGGMDGYNRLTNLSARPSGVFSSL